MKKAFFTLISSAFLFVANSQVLLNEGFEGNSFPPLGWTLINGNAPKGLNWTSNTDTSLNYDPYPAHAGRGSMVYEYDPALAAKAWAITPPLQLTAGISYSISFFYKIQDPDYPEKMKVTVGNAATTAAQTTVLWNNSGGSELTDTFWRPGVVKYTPTVTGNYYFGFNCYSDLNKFALTVDDIRVEVTPATVPGCTSNLLPVNNATSAGVSPTTLSWKSSAAATSYDVYTGENISSVKYLTNVSDTSTAFAGSYSTAYFWYVVPRNAAGISSGCAGSVTSFITEALPAVPANDEVCKAITLTLDSGADCQNTVSATSTGDSSLTCSVANNTVWYKFTSTNGSPVALKMKRRQGAELNLNAWIGFFTTTGVCPSLKLTQQFDCYSANLAANDSVVVVSDNLAPNTTYYIMVDGFSGSVGKFCVSLASPPAPPGCISIISPANGATNVNAPSVDFLWRKNTFATGYTIYMGTTSLVADDTIKVNGDTSTTLSPMAYNTTYYWSVVPLNGALSASDCPVYSFTTAERTLPVSLSSFYGQQNNSINELFWTTQTEQNNKGFDLQKSSDGNNFRSIAFIATKAVDGNSTATLNYSFTDNKPLPGNNYYRLNQLDKDGRSSVSKVVLLKNGNTSGLVLTDVYPNPASSKITVSISAGSSERISIIITDMAGKTVMQQTGELIQGDNKIPVNISRLSAGSYLVKAICSNGCETTVTKFVRQ